MNERLNVSLFGREAKNLNKSRRTPLNDIPKGLRRSMKTKNERLNSSKPNKKEPQNFVHSVINQSYELPSLTIHNTETDFEALSHLGNMNENARLQLLDVNEKLINFNMRILKS